MSQNNQTTAKLGRQLTRTFSCFLHQNGHKSLDFRHCTKMAMSDFEKRAYALSEHPESRGNVMMQI